VSAEQHKAMICRFYDEVWNNGNLDVADEIFADDYVRHDLRPGTAPPGPEGQKAVASLFRAAFPDVHLTVNLMVADQETVVARWTMAGTQRGAWGGIAPTGKSISFAGVNIFRFAAGKVVEIWNHRDDLGLMQQLGAPVHAGYPERRSR
jgi:steroid delta-isomerase-like uncharacterized protein